MYGVLDNQSELSMDIAAVLASLGKTVGASREAAGQLEACVTAFTGAKHCVTTKSGTQALTVTLTAVGVGPGSVVITSPWTFIATATAATSLGAEVVFADVKSDDWTVNPVKVAELLDRYGSRVSCVVPVDLFGCPCDYRELLELCVPRGIPVVEDACQAFTGEYRGARLGNVGCTAAVTSFYPTKPLGGYGEGGAVLTNDDTLAEVLRVKLNHGSTVSEHNCTTTGENGRIDPLGAALLVEKFKRINTVVAKRRAIDVVYREMLTDVVFQKLSTDKVSALYGEQVYGSTKVIDDLRSILVTNDLYSRDVCDNTYFSNWRSATRTSGILSARSINLPINEFMNVDELRDVLGRR